MTAIAMVEPAEVTVLTRREQRAAGLQLTLAMLALGLIALALGLRFLEPERGAISELVAGAAAVLVAIPVAASAWHSIRHPDLHGITDQLIAMALLAAWATGDLMTAAVLPIVMIFGHVLEERSLVGSQEAIRSLARLARNGARRLRADGSVEEIASDALRAGDRVEVRAGDRVPADGTVLDGSASLDTSPITGESVPAEVKPGGQVYAGSIDLDGVLKIEVTRAGAESTLGRVVALMQAAERSKPPITRLLEAYAGRYMTLVLLIAAGTYFTTGDSARMLAVLVAACPCALVLAAPATAVAAIAVAARHGLLIKGAGFLEELAETTSLILDKTGTLTLGELSLVEVVATDGDDPAALLRLAGSLGAASAHPVSRALAETVPPAERIALTDLHEERGLGVVGTADGTRAALGRPELFRSLGIEPGTPPEHDGPMVGLAVGERFAGWFLLADRARPEARAAIAELRGLGLGRAMMITGDREIVARRIAATVGVPELVAEALPQQKLDRVVAETRQGFRPLVVGDGINDALALKAGAVGIAMGMRGTDVALASADIVLMTNDLRRLGTAVRLSRRCRRTIQVNVAIGIGWTVAIVVAAELGWLGAEGALLAAVVHNLSTLLVMGNAGRLLRFEEPLRPVG